MRPATHPRDLRASDADRERVVAALTDAAGDGRLSPDEHADRVRLAYRAQTLGQLAALTADLAPPSGQPFRLDLPGHVSAFLTTVRREGRWVVPGRLPVSAVGSRVILDLREAILQQAHTIVTATLVGSQLHLLVPEGLAVRVVPAHRAGPRGPLPGAAHPAPGSGPVLEVRAFTVAGSVRVYTPRRAGSRWRRRQRRRLT